MSAATKNTGRRRGGKRAGAGRKARDGTKGLLPFRVSLDSSTVIVLTELGKGNLSQGIREAARRV